MGGMGGPHWWKAPLPWRVLDSWADCNDLSTHQAQPGLRSALKKSACEKKRCWKTPTNLIQMDPRFLLISGIFLGKLGILLENFWYLLGRPQFIMCIATWHGPSGSKSQNLFRPRSFLLSSNTVFIPCKYPPPAAPASNPSRSSAWNQKYQKLGLELG